MNAIVCVNYDNGIGKDDKLLFKFKEDMDFFRYYTVGKVLVMGRKTFNSLPNKAPLKNRTTIVVTSSKDNIEEDSKYKCSCYAYMKKIKLKGKETIISGIHPRDKNSELYVPNTNLIVVNDVVIVEDVCELFGLASDPVNNGDNIFICGGESIYRYFLPKCNQIYITKVLEKNNIESDRFFPEINEDEWVRTDIFTYNHKAKITNDITSLIYSIILSRKGYNGYKDTFDELAENGIYC